jgi:hypothetical protein
MQIQSETTTKKKKKKKTRARKKEKNIVFKERYKRRGLSRARRGRERAEFNPLDEQVSHGE